MGLLTEELRDRLPPMHSQEAEDEPWVYACFFLLQTTWRWYVIEGEPLAGDFLFFGFVEGLESEFCQFLLSELEALRGPKDVFVQRQESFIEGKLTDVVPAPDL